MSGYTRYIFITLLAGMILYSCKKAYTPEITTQNANFLVVEGVVNASDSTFIKLSRTVKLTDGVGTSAQTGANVSVEEEGGPTFNLQEKPGGNYVAPTLPIDAAKKYRLHIRSAGKEYVSDFVEVKTTPLIDRVNFDITTTEMAVNVDTHDDSGNTRYYRWEFDETWEFNANYRSLYKSNGDTVIERDIVNDDIYHCWTSNVSKTIVLGSSAKLSQDVIKDFTVTAIPASSEKIGIKYSILVKQYALTKQEFEFWQNLKKNTEQLGTIFDPQPSQLRGNIRCVSDPTEQVIGYVGVCTVAKQRSFIDKERLMTYRTLPFYTDCREDSILLKRERPPAPPVNEENLVFNKNKGGQFLLPTTALTQAGTVIGHFGTLPRCADCTLRGTKRKPDFWE